MEGITVLAVLLALRSSTLIVRRSAILYLIRSQRSVVIVDEVDGVFVYNPLELSLVGCRTTDSDNVIVPTGEVVAVLVIARACCRRLNRSSTIFVFLTGENSIVVVEEGDGVLANGRSVGCSVSCLTCYLCQLRSPLVELISVLCILLFGRCCACVCRHCAVLYLSLLQLRTVIVQETYSILVHCLGVSGSVCHITRYSAHLRCPSLERVSVLSGCCLGRGLTRVCRHCTILYVLVLLQFCTAFIYPGYSVSVLG